MHRSGIVRIVQLLVHEYDIKCTLIIDYIIFALFNMLEGVLVLDHNLSIVGSHFLLDISMRAHVLPYSLSKHHRVLTIIYSLQ